MSHKVRRHIWEGGILHTFDHFFEELAHALDFTKENDADHVKIYDENNQVVHVSGPVTAPTTYA